MLTQNFMGSEYMARFAACAVRFDQKETLFNNFNLHLIFRINDPTTADFLSKAYGVREVVKKFSSSQMIPTDLGDRISISEQEKLEMIILPTQFQA